MKCFILALLLASLALSTAAVVPDQAKALRALNRLVGALDDSAALSTHGRSLLYSRDQCEWIYGECFIGPTGTALLLSSIPANNSLAGILRGYSICYHKLTEAVCAEDPANCLFNAQDQSCDSSRLQSDFVKCFPGPNAQCGDHNTEAVCRNDTTNECQWNSQQECVSAKGPDPVIPDSEKPDPKLCTLFASFGDASARSPCEAYTTQEACLANLECDWSKTNAANADQGDNSGPPCGANVGLQFANLAFPNQTQANDFAMKIRQCQQQTTQEACVAMQVPYSGTYIKVSGTYTFPNGSAAFNTDKNAFKNTFKSLVAESSGMGVPLVNIDSTSTNGNAVTVQFSVLFPEGSDNFAQTFEAKMNSTPDKIFQTNSAFASYGNATTTNVQSSTSNSASNTALRVSLVLLGLLVAVLVLLV